MKKINRIIGILIFVVLLFTSCKRNCENEIISSIDKAKECRISTVKAIILKDSTYSKFPVDFLEYPFIEKIHVFSIKKFTVTEEMTQFKNLNQIRFQEVDSLENIEVLYRMNNLKTLLIGSCHMNYIDSSIVGLKSLKVLSLRNNNIAELPYSFFKLKNLNDIDLSSNEFKKFPEVLKKMDRLEYLSFRDNPINVSLDSMGYNKKYWPKIKLFSFDTVR